MPYKDPAKRAATSAAASKKWRERFKAEDPEGFREYTRAAQRRWIENMSDGRRQQLRDYYTARRRARGIQPRPEAVPREKRERERRAAQEPRPRKVAITPAQFAADASDPRHGTVNGYKNLRCRCEMCRVANTEFQAKYRVRRAEREARS